MYLKKRQKGLAAALSGLLSQRLSLSHWC